MASRRQARPRALGDRSPGRRHESGPEEAARAAEEREQRRKEALAQAERDPIERRRGEALRAELASWVEVRRVREYCAAMAERYPGDEDVDEWREWAMAFANRIDPLRRPPSMPPTGGDPPRRPATPSAWLERVLMAVVIRSAPGAGARHSSGMTVEHVMPRAWRAPWASPWGADPLASATERARLLYTIQSAPRSDSRQHRADGEGERGWRGSASRSPTAAHPRGHRAVQVAGELRLKGEQHRRGSAWGLSSMLSPCSAETYGLAWRNAVGPRLASARSCHLAARQTRRCVHADPGWRVVESMFAGLQHVEDCRCGDSWSGDVRSSRVDGRGNRCRRSRKG